MGIRKNAKFLSADEKLNYVGACVKMKADIVNPGAMPPDQYSRWDEYVAIHAKIQNATAPGPITNINFGHGGAGAYGFLSWHRYFLYQFELQLQTYAPVVPGLPPVTIPYWDWSDPASITVASFLGPNGGGVATNNIVNQGYFAYNKPGSAATPAAGGVPAMPANATALPVWWPATLPGWRLPGMFPAANIGGLKRRFRGLGALPPILNIQECLTRPDYPAFQLALESGVGLITPPITIMHNAMHSWVGDGVGHMQDAKVSSFDPIFYVLHCNVDRLWAMWQMDGHATEFPLAGGNPQHHLNDIMYPWIGATAGYSTQSTVAPTIPMPGGLPIKHNADTLDFRALGYSYDCIPIIGLGLDRTGSMSGLTPNPHTGMGTVTKWVAATMGVSAFLQDCEAVKTSGLVYITAGVKTFRSLAANDFVNVFAAPGYGLIKTGSPSFSKAAFDGAIVAMAPGGGTPLADALNNVQTTLVQAPFGGLPANERRYMAFLTDGILTTGAPMSSIPNGSFTNTAIFAMGFGTGADVDYTTLASMVAKGITLTTTQIFHGDNAGIIDKFYENALAAAIGFTPLVDPLIELFAGEHTHLDFFATSADDCFLITAQGMDFQDINWSFMLHAPNDEILYGDERGHSHTSMSCHHCCPPPNITARRSNGRLTLVIQRGNTDIDCWVGKWQLMISYKAKSNDKMMMQDIGELMYPVSAGQIRGPRYARLLINPKNWVATRNVFTSSQHGLDGRAASTNSSDNEACSILVNIFGRTSLKLNLQAVNSIVKKGEELKIFVDADISIGSIQYHRAFVRFTTPAFDIAQILPPQKVQEIIKEIEASKRYNRKLDIALILAQYEKENKDVQFIKDKEGQIVSHEGGPLHIHEQDTNIPGLYHFGIYIEGAYFPGTEAKPDGHHDHGAAAKKKMEAGDDINQVITEKGEMFTRVLNITVAVVNEIIVTENKS
jgi:hypothetical protein